MSEAIFTIGHSTHSQERFIALLKQHDITALGDVRSKPYSRTNPQFNREDLKKQLKEVGIAYVFLGKELGARSEDSACYEQGRVQYDRLALTDQFQHGLDRAQDGMNSYRLALMCAEKEPWSVTAPFWLRDTCLSAEFPSSTSSQMAVWKATRQFSSA